MNSVALIGRLTRDPELRYVAGSGTPVASFNLAVDKTLSREKKQQFEQQNKPTADFLRIIVWGKQAENCANYLAKGRKVAVQGSISTSMAKNSEGVTQYYTDIVASNVEFLEFGDKKNQGNNGPVEDDFASDFRPIDDDEPF